MNRSDRTTHEDHFNLPACWGGTKAEAEAMRAKRAKRRIILEIVYVIWRRRVIRVRVSRGGVQRRFRQSARAEGAEGRRRKATIDRRKPSSSSLQVGRSPGSFFGTDVAWTHSTRRSALYMKSREETDGRRDEKTDDKRHTYVRLRTVVTNERNEPHIPNEPRNPAARRPPPDQPTNHSLRICSSYVA